ncbi:hypothetical protein ABZP36_034911 [Zizania latifolia]
MRLRIPSLEECQVKSEKKGAEIDYWSELGVACHGAAAGSTDLADGKYLTRQRSACTRALLPGLSSPAGLPRARHHVRGLCRTKGHALFDGVPRQCQLA